MTAYHTSKLISYSYRPTGGHLTATTHTPPSKSLQTKQLGGTNSELASWYEQAYEYYNAVLSGAEPHPGPASWNQFLQYMDWAVQQLGMSGSNWGEGIDSQVQPRGPVQQPLPTGAIAGSNGNIVYDQMDANIQHTQENRPIDLYSNNIVINSGSMMTTFTSEVTTDTRLQPPDQVLKITASDGTVYFVHDYQDAKIKIRTPTENQLVDYTDSDNPDLVTWEDYNSRPARGTEAKGWTGGVIEEVDENHWVHIGNAGETIDFNPQVDDDEVVKYREVHGEANISIRSDCSADVTVNAEGDTVVTVKDREGNTLEVITVIKGYPVQVNHSNAENDLSINGQALRPTTDSDGNETFLAGGIEGLSINGTPTVVLILPTAEPIEDDDIPVGN